MKLDKDISKVTKPELIKILRLCIGKHCDECPLAGEFDRDACYRILMVRTVEEFYTDAGYVLTSIAYLKSIRNKVDAALKEVGEALKEGEEWGSLN